jgi:hypothetical protein
VTLVSSLNVLIGAVLFVACGADSGTPNTFLQIVKDGFIIYSSDNPSATPNNFEFTIEAGSTYSIISNVHAAPPVLQWLVDNDDATGDNVGRLIITVNGVEQVNENATGVGSITPPIGSAVVITFYDDLASAADEISLTVNDDLLGELYNVSGDGSTPLSYSYTATGQVLVAFGRAYAAAACTPVAVVGTLDAMPNAIAGQPYFYSFAINSDATPTVNLYPSSKPSWMTIAKVGNEIHFTGIPSTIAENVDVMVAVVNCDGAGSIEFVDMINIVWPELTITALYFDTSFSAALNVPIDVDINIINTFSTCFDTCGGSSIGSMQHVPVVTIPAGSLGITYDSLSNTGTNGPHQRVDNAININGTPYNNGATVATGGISVVLHLQQCT